MNGNMETVVIIPSKADTKPPTQPPVQKPAWMVKMVRRQEQLNKRYELAHSQFATAYNDFLATIDEINIEHGTDFSFSQAVTEYQGYFAEDAFDEVEDDDEDDED